MKLEPSILRYSDSLTYSKLSQNDLYPSIDTVLPPHQCSPQRFAKTAEAGPLCGGTRGHLRCGPVALEGAAPRTSRSAVDGARVGRGQTSREKRAGSDDLKSNRSFLKDAHPQRMQLHQVEGPRTITVRLFSKLAKRETWRSWSSLPHRPDSPKLGSPCGTVEQGRIHSPLIFVTASPFLHVLMKGPLGNEFMEAGLPQAWRS